MDLSSAHVIATNGIKSVQFSFVTSLPGSPLSLSYNASTQQVVLTTANASIFASPLFATPVVFQMNITDNSPQCVTPNGIAIYNSGCSSIFNVSVQALAVIGCPSDIEVALSSSSSATQSVVWTEPDLLAEYSYLSVARPGDLFPIGSTSVVYGIDHNVQSSLQTSVSLVTCEFTV